VKCRLFVDEFVLASNSTIAAALTAKRAAGALSNSALERPEHEERNCFWAAMLALEDAWLAKLPLAAGPVENIVF